MKNNLDSVTIRLLALLMALIIVLAACNKAAISVEADAPTINENLPVNDDSGSPITALASNDEEAILALIELVESLGLPHGIEMSLLAKLNQALENLSKDKAAAAGNLKSFNNLIKAQQGKKIPSSDADSLLNLGEAIIKAIPIEVVKTANPTSVSESSGGEEITFTVTVTNNSHPNDPLTINSLIDDIHGDLNGQGNCLVPQIIQPNASYTCSFIANVSGNAKDIGETDTVTASGTDSKGNPVSDSDTATVAFIDNSSPDIEVSKTANPTSVSATGEDVTFTVEVTNNSGLNDPVIIDTLTDNIHGDLHGQGNCTVPQTIQVGETYTCSFIVVVEGSVGEPETDTVTASGTDDESNPVSDSDDAVVAFTCPDEIKLIPSFDDSGILTNLREFGHSVAMSGNTMVVGARNNSWYYGRRGTAHIYERNACDKWMLVKILLPTHPNIIDVNDGDDDSFLEVKSVAISGDTVVIGTDFSNGAGLLYIYNRHQGGPNNWGLVKEIRPPNDYPNWESSHLFGQSVAISGNTVVVGDPFLLLSNNGFTGAIFIYARDQDGPNNWGLVTEKVPTSTRSRNSFMHFGHSVAISGNTMVVGAWADDDNGSFSGAAYIFDRPHSTSQWNEFKKIRAFDGELGDNFGWSVAISGDTVVVGARSDDNNSGIDSGAAYIYDRNKDGPNNWGLVRKRKASDGAADDKFGWSVAISGDTVVVGANRDNDNGDESGSAYIFGRDQGGPNNWGEVQKMLPSDGAADDEFGFSVATSGNTVVVGSPYNDNDADDTPTNNGAAYVYE